MDKPFNDGSVTELVVSLMADDDSGRAQAGFGFADFLEHIASYDDLQLLREAKAADSLFSKLPDGVTGECYKFALEFAKLDPSVRRESLLAMSRLFRVSHQCSTLEGETS